VFLSLFAIFFRVVVRESREGVLGTNEGEFLVDVRDVSGSPVSCAECVSYLPRKRIRHVTHNAKVNVIHPLNFVICFLVQINRIRERAITHHAPRRPPQQSATTRDMRFT
jgi:hypothetical protein